MKKYIILSIIVIIAISSIYYLFNNYKVTAMQVENNNKMYTEIYNKEITGSTLATIINKTLDKNEKNEEKKDNNDYYISNNENYIIIEIKFQDSDDIFRVEQIAKNGIENFIKLYSNLNFKCTKIEYHKKTNYISYLYFEQI